MSPRRPPLLLERVVRPRTTPVRSQPTKALRGALWESVVSIENERTVGLTRGRRGIPCVWHNLMAFKPLGLSKSMFGAYSIS